MANFRVYFPVHYIAIGEYASESGLPVHGGQTLNLTTTFNLEQAFEHGQLDIYENIENLPDIELTIDKVLDGYPLLYHLGTQGATTSSLANRTNQRADIFLTVFDDALESSTGVPETQAYCSGMYVNSLNYTLPVEGNSTESVTFIGNDKVWRTSTFAFDGHFDGNDSPAAAIQRRQHVQMGNAAGGGSVWPTNLPGVTVVNGSGYNMETTGQFGAHIQDTTISVNLGREDLFELGRRKPYYRFASFPTAVDCTINMTAGGSDPGDAIDADSESEANLSDEPIVVKISDGTVWDLGTKNKLQSVSYSGGDATGGVVTLSYAFQNFNVLNITSPADPEGILPVV